VQYFVYDQGYIHAINEQFIIKLLDSTDDKLLESINEICDKHFGIT